MFLLGWILLVIVLLLLVLMRASLVLCGVVMVLGIFLLSIFLSFAGLILLMGSLVLCVPAVRYRLFSRTLFLFFKKNIPPMSRTESEAIAAGDVWWDAELFSGRPNFRAMMKFQLKKLSDEEQHFLDHTVETLCEMLDDWQITQNLKDLPADVWAYLKREGFFGMVIDKQYGGLGFSAIAHSTVVMKIATRSPSAAIAAMVPNSLGPGELIHRYGTLEQKNYYMPRLAKGLEIPCFALTGPFAGSDAASMRDTGVVCYEKINGESVLGIRLNWSKHYITLAPVATLLGLAFKLYDPEQLIGPVVDIGITLCLIPTDHPGVNIGRRHYPMHMAFMNGPTSGTDVFVPMSYVIGGQEKVGQGWRMLMECLSTGRSVSLPAISTACAKHAYRLTGAYAWIREQFNMPIAKFEGVNSSLSQIAGCAYLMESVRTVTCAAVDAGFSPAIVSAIAKYHLTELFRSVVNHALDVHGGRGIQLGPKNYLASAYVGVPVAITVEGANILTRNLIIFGQGLVRCHPYLLKEMEAVQRLDARTGLKEFDKILLKHMRYTLNNLVRSLFFGLTHNVLTRTPIKGVAAVYVKDLTRMSSALALTADVALLVLGGDLKRKENLSARLGDVLSYLYMASTVLYTFEHSLKTRDDTEYMQWACQYCLHHIQIAFDDFFFNFPQKVIARVLRFVIFPYGRAFKKPSDRLSQNLTRAMLSNSAFRDQLIQHSFVGTAADDPAGRVERAFQTVLQAEPIFQRIKQAIHAHTLSKSSSITDAHALGVINDAELLIVQAAQDARAQVITVDDFPFSYFKGDAHES